MEQSEYWIMVAVASIIIGVSIKIVIRAIKDCDTTEDVYKTIIAVATMCGFIGAIIFSIVYHGITGW